MKLVQSRIITKEVTALARFYEKLTGVTPEGSDEYVEIDIAGTGIAICSKRSVDMFSGGVAIAEANHSVILDFQVEDVYGASSTCRIRSGLRARATGPALGKPVHDFSRSGRQSD